MLRKIMIMILLILTVVWFTNSDSIQPAREFIQNNIYVWSEMQEEKLPIYCVDTQKKQIALTFDTAWGNEDIPQILKILKQVILVGTLVSMLLSKIQQLRNFLMEKTSNMEMVTCIFTVKANRCIHSIFLSGKV